MIRDVRKVGLASSRRAAARGDGSLFGGWTGRRAQGSPNGSPGRAGCDPAELVQMPLFGPRLVARNDRDLPFHSGMDLAKVRVDTRLCAGEVDGPRAKRGGRGDAEAVGERRRGDDPRVG